MITDDDRKNAWLSFATAAIAGFEPTEDVDTADEYYDELMEESCLVADDMLKEFEARFGKGTGRGRRKGKKPSRGDEEDDG